MNTCVYLYVKGGGGLYCMCRINTVTYICFVFIQFLSHLRLQIPPLPPPLRNEQIPASASCPRDSLPLACFARACVRAFVSVVSVLLHHQSSC